MAGATELEAAGWLSTRAVERLAARVEHAIRGARAGESRLVSVSESLSGDHDPAAIVTRSRNADDAWFCFEQPDRDRYAIGALGVVHELGGSAEGRFGAADRAWRQCSARALADQPGGPAGSGLIATAGFAFASGGGSSPAWDGFGAASVCVPEVSFARQGTQTWITVTAAVAPGEMPQDVTGRVVSRLADLREGPLPLLDPAPAQRPQVHSPMPPSHYEEAVARAVERIRAGELEKVVLAREVQVTAAVDHDPAAIYGVMRETFPSCFSYAVGRGGATFLGATPELLIRRAGQRASTVALAGSTRRSADPSVDAHLGVELLQSGKNRAENAIVARRITRALTPYSVWVAAAPEPIVVRVANIQHLGLPIRAQLRRDVSALELAGALHPTPAVGGEPSGVAQELIPALEGLDRGWYAGAVGWVDTSGDGELCVALRCAVLRGRLASCFAGCGIVADSEPAAELAESETKLEALLPLLCA